MRYQDRLNRHPIGHFITLVRGVIVGGLLLSPAAWALSISDTPLYLTSQVRPNVLFDLSIESPMQGAAYNDHTGSVAGCTGRPASEYAEETSVVNHNHTGKTSNTNYPTYTINDYDSGAASPLTSNIVSVTVKGYSISYEGTYTGTCQSNQPSNSNRYKVKTVDSDTLEFCFKTGSGSNDRKDENITVVHKIRETDTGDTLYGIGTCYFKTQTYRGYFDSRKCYQYDSGNGRFNPVASPTYDIGASATCGGSYWSGNFLNWSTMTAIDEFRMAMTGGHRSTDTASLTVLERANQGLGKGNSWFPLKKIGSGVGPGNVAPSTVSPYAYSTLYLYNHGVQFDVGDSAFTNDATNLYARAKVCDSAVGLETNCASYGSSKKPVGLVQNNSDRMRFAVTSYLKDDSKSRDGGVLRSRMKQVGPKKYVVGSGLVSNSNKEWSETDGTFITNPDTTDATASGVSASGVINYINKFGANGYKSADPVGELFYESLRYFKNKGNTPEYSSGLTTAMKDGFPVITSWDDPIQYSCQKNFIVAINDANPWLDKRLPGTYFTCDKAGSTGMPASFDYSDCGEPSNPDSDINVRTLTNTVGDLEGLNDATWSNSGTWTSGTVSGTNDSVGYVAGVSSNMGSCNASKTVGKLGEVMGTCPAEYKQNSYYVAGLAYYANTTDLRPDLDDKQTVSTFMIDTQEYNSSPLDGPKNMLWLAGKYGGFTDTNNNDQPDLPKEWDADSDGVPDNYVMANNPDKMINALTKAFVNINKESSSASAVATNSTRVSTGTKIFQARFESGSWTGQLLAIPFESGGATFSTVSWDAADQIPAAASRNIFTLSGGSGVEFLWASLSTAQKDYLDLDNGGSDDNLGQDRLNWLRGSKTKEVTESGGVFRSRTISINDESAKHVVLGDIINSDPYFVGAQNFAYDIAGWGSLSTSYATFRTNNAKRTPMVYVGANDGMLHGFNANSGKEVFAYIPNALFPNLSKLTAPNYAHRYYVDGSPYVGEAYLSGAWKSVLLGGLNGGGKAVYALDVTTPTSNGNDPAAGDVPSAFTASNVMWEFTHADLGYTYGQPQVARLENGTWVAIFGNGYDSGNDKALLFIVDLASGSLLKAIDTGVGSGAAENGLSPPALIDSDGDFMVDTVYAGDLQGNLWKFDVSHASAVQWDVAYKDGSTPKPLFTARNGSNQVQPITAPLEVGVAPEGYGGLMIYFGTGSYFQSTDHADKTVQSFYGILDNGTRIAETDRSTLAAQSITDEVSYDPDADVSGDEKTYRTTSANAVDYDTQRGWYMDLKVSGGDSLGERVVSAPLLRYDRVVFVTLIPKDDDPCSPGGDSWLMELDAATGKAPQSSWFDINNDGKFDENDQVDDQYVSGEKSEVGIIKTPAVVSEGGTDYLVASGSTTGIMKKADPGTRGKPRTSWIQVQ